jgi:hypothetical protein
MATTVTTLTNYLSDLSESEADQTVRFAIGNSDDTAMFEIDLTAVEADELFRALHPYIENGRRVIDLEAPRKARRTGNGRGASDAKLIRAWATENSINVPAKGRVPQSVREAYAAYSTSH